MSEAETQQQQAVANDKPEETVKEKKKRAKKSSEGTNDDEEHDKPKRSRGNFDMSVHDMIVEALEVLRDRKGVTLPSIKRYLEENFKMDTHKANHHIKKAILNGVDNGKILRLRGHGAAGRFNVKHTRPPMIKKRKAPEEYMELPPPTKKRKATTTSKAKPKEGKEEKEAAKGKTAKATPTKATPKGKAKGRFGRKK